MDKFKKLALSTLLLASTPFAAATAFLGSDFYVNPYVAAEAGWRHSPWESAFGERHFKEQHTNLNFILGAQFHDYFAVEGGFQTTDQRQKQSFYFGAQNVTEEPVLGFLNGAGNEASSLHMAQSKIDGWHLNLVGLLPVLPKTTLFASVGVAWMKFHVNTVPVYDHNVLTTANPVSQWNSSRDAVLRLGIGVKQMITENFGSRLFLNWENTSLEGRIPGTGVVNPPTLDSEFYTAKSKNSYVVGLGFYYQFCPSKG
ncbi:outer membrane beta-barrel protein [Candidatus Berkiella cookevillensis]|nr:outer membrane beta-barrel protein [Candidatus Berkiella cookevillensis]MCS5708880.1 outer membrane beta-barrel protein [Candidatus Berkiella cookevillensis]